ncbi:TonB-dependent receptor [Aquimarina agarivorans]|uniref:TonB-dependent receptor n=1 Tax=Aquimarina agarivorans TaxID=980584 RepID=UPI000248E78D|nr:TonB-dependent receptor [Aquimarina agarivorans]
MKKITFYFFFILNLSFAQQKNSSFRAIDASLLPILKEIEQKFEVKFSYNPEWISKEKVSLQLQNPTINQILAELQRQLHFIFIRIDERYISIKPTNKVYVCGYLKDTALKKPIENATITVLKQKLKTITSTNGYFQISDVNINDTIVIKSLGFESRKIPAVNFYKKCNDLFLEDKLYLLNEVVVKEYLSSSISLMNGGVVNFDLSKPDILAGQAEPDVLQSVQLLPGIDSVTENATDLVIRGSSPDKNLILWDGIKLYNTDHFFGTLTNLNTSIVNNVSIQKSGVDSKFGDRVSGVIDINLDSDLPKKIASNIGLNPLHIDFSLKLPIAKKLGLIFSTRRSLTDFYKTEAFNNNFNRIFQNSRVQLNRQAFNTDVQVQQKQNLIYEDHSAKLIYNFLSKHSFSSTVLVTNNKYEDQIGFLASEATGNVDVTFFDDLKIKNLGAVGVLDSNWNKKFDTTIGIRYSNYSLNYVGFSFNPVFNFPFELERFNEIDEVSSYANANYQLSKKITLATGYEIFSTRIKTGIFVLTDEFFNIDQKNKPAHSFYGQVIYNKPKKTNVSLGLRVNKVANFDDLKWEPRLSLGKNVTKKLRARASAEIRHQSINRVQVLSGFDTGEENEIWLPSIQDSIPLLKSTQVSAGIIYKKRNWVFDVDMYYKKSEGLTMFPISTVNLLNIIPEEGRGEAKGVDFLLKKKFKNYTTWLGYSYSKNEQQFQNINNNRVFDANNDIRHSLTWSHFFEWKNFQVSLGWRYRTGIPFTKINQLSLNGLEPDSFDALNEKRLPDYHRLDASLTYVTKLSKINSDQKLKFGVSLQNVYNKENILDIRFGRRITSQTINIDATPLEFKTKSLGITPNFYIRLFF